MHVLAYISRKRGKRGEGQIIAHSAVRLNMRCIEYLTVEEIDWEGLYCTEPFHLGLALGKVPVRTSRNKSHKYKGIWAYISASDSL